MDLKALQKERGYFAHISKYYKPDTFIALQQLLLTFLIYFLTFHFENYNYLAKFCSIFIRSLIYVRMFVIMHDAGHESFLKNKLGNDIIGCLMASCLLGDFFDWRKRHNLHHQTTNNINYVQSGQSAPLNVSHFINMSERGRKIYLTLFSPFGMIFIIPTLYRIYNLVTIIKKDRICLAGGLAINLVKLYFFGFLEDQAALELAALLGVLIFHAQHTFKELKRKSDISFLEQGLIGSTNFLVPEIFKFFTLGIEYHHIHHLNAKIPSYYLRQCHDDGEKKLKNYWDIVRTVNIKEVFDFSLILYDENQGRLITRKELKNLYGI